MVRVARAAPFAAVLLAASAVSRAAAPTVPAGRPPGAMPSSPAAAALHDLIKSEWLREMREDPLEASADGFHQYDAFWPDVSLATLAREHQEDLQTLKDLAAIDRGALKGEDRISYDLFKYRYGMRVEDYQLKGYLMPINELDGIQTLQDSHPYVALPERGGLPKLRPSPADLQALHG